MPISTLFLLNSIPLPHAKSFLLIICLGVAWFAPRLGDRVFRFIESVLVRLANHQRLVIPGCALGVILLRVSLLGIIPVPVPAIHDEFGYLLSADTFAHRRLTNPPHPMWIFLDTFQVNQRPTYMSRYPPAQGAVMALGQLLGNPWFGVLLSVSAMCAAVLWALQAWLPPAWALLGAGLVALRIGTFNYWTNSYYGGAVAAIGGALVIGALPRIKQNQRARDAWLLGLGIAILANSRPFEGFVFCLPVAAALGVWLFRSPSRSWRMTARQILLPIGVCLLATGAFMAYYNWRLTGDALLQPLVLNQRTYFRGQPVFIWQKRLPPIHTINAQFDSYYNIFPGGFDGTWRGLVAVSWKKIVKFHDFFLFTEPALVVPLLVLPWLLRKQRTGLLSLHAAFCLAVILIVLRMSPTYTIAVVSTLPLLGLLWLLRDAEVRFVIIELIVAFVGLLLVIAFLEHYAAPLLAAFFILLMQAMRHLRNWEHRGRPVGLALSRVVVLFVVGTFPALIAQEIQHPGSVPPVTRPWSRARAQAEARLEAMPGQHLVIVRYSPQHDYNAESVFNLADIDHAKVVWARELPGIDMQPLLNYFAGRQVWLMEPDVSPELIPYASAPRLSSSK